jgi:16S rRNA (adenine1518-N6/adenine1519-N6)-dimethyltransferase
MTHRARKRFGQNFLHDANVIRRIIQSINPQPGQALVEIGPGQGAITLPLLQACGHLEVIELDRDLIEPLARKAQTAGTLIIHQADALKFDFRPLAQDRKLRLVGNLPYNISTPLLFHLLSQADYIQDMHFMLQKEVVDRMAAGPGGGEYGRLSVMIQYHCRVEPLFHIGPGAFRPAPKIDSAFVRLTPWPQAPAVVDDYASLSTVVRQAFSQRRKTLRNTLRNLLDEAQIRDSGCDPTARPETLTLQQYASLANRLAQQR